MSTVAHAEIPAIPRPRLRGVSHAYAAFVAGVIAIVLVATSSSGAARLAALIYGAGLIALFAGSGLYHRWPWDPRWRPLLRRVDHSTIFIFIAASYTPPALLVLHGTTQALVLAGVWLGALAGVTLSVAWIDAPRLAVALAYIGIGWVIVIALPQVFDETGAVPTALFLGGGLLYSAGATIYAARRPDPWPRTFGFHELFHLLVVAAAIVHFIAMAAWVVPYAAA